MFSRTLVVQTVETDHHRRHCCDCPLNTLCALHGQLKPPSNLGGERDWERRRKIQREREDEWESYWDGITSHRAACVACFLCIHSVMTQKKLSFRNPFLFHSLFSHWMTEWKTESTDWKLCFVPAIHFGASFSWLFIITAIKLQQCCIINMPSQTYNSCQKFQLCGVLTILFQRRNATKRTCPACKSFQSLHNTISSIHSMQWQVSIDEKMRS